MKQFLKKLTISSVALAALAQGQTPPPSSDVARPVELIPMKPESLNRVNVSYRLGLNITADFKNIGGFRPLSNPGLALGGAVNRTYDNGYNLVDITGNNHGPGFENTTWNWGYQDAGSVQGNQLVLSSGSSPANVSSKDNSNDPQQGFEIGYGRQLFRKDNWRFGLESALGFSRMSISDSRTLRGSVNLITDSFTIPATVVVPPAPYSGDFVGAGAVIGSEPSSRSTSIVAQQAIIRGSRTLEADVYSLRLGPYAEVPLNEKFSLQFNTGLYLAVGDMNFSFVEAVTIPGTGTQVHSGSGSQTDFLVGGYAGINVGYELTKDVGLFVGAQFQSAGRPVNQERGKEAILNLNKSVIVSIGATYSF